MSDESIFPPGRVTILGVLNATPDSFSDGGRFVGPGPAGDGERLDLEAALRVGQELLRDGAHLLDVGGESTRPGADDVPVERELARVVPLVRALVDRFGARVSIDTRKAAVAREGLAAGATVVNDVSGLGTDPEVAREVARAGAGLVVGHLRGTPRDMQRAPHFDDVLVEVADELSRSLDRARAAGVADRRLAVDPGIGFGKGLAENLQLVAHAGWFRERLGVPVLIGASRKSFLGFVTGDPPDERETASHAAAAVAVFAGADAVRVHDVAGARRAVAVARALRDARRKELT